MAKAPSKHAHATVVKLVIVFAVFCSFQVVHGTGANERAKNCVWQTKSRTGERSYKGQGICPTWPLVHVTFPMQNLNRSCQTAALRL
jgi:hypothetical protein